MPSSKTTRTVDGSDVPRSRTNDTSAPEPSVGIVSVTETTLAVWSETDVVKVADSRPLKTAEATICVPAGPVVESTGPVLDVQHVVESVAAAVVSSVSSIVVAAPLVRSKDVASESVPTK